MIINRAFKTELDLNNKQKTACSKHAGSARFAYNWGLSRKIAVYQAKEKVPTAIDLHRELNAFKKTELPWMYEVSKCAPQEALRNLDRAFAHFFRKAEMKKADKFKGKVGFPKFKSKKRGLGSFRLTGSIHVFEDSIQLPRLGRLRLKEKDYLPTKEVKILSATVSERAGRWFVSVQIEMNIPEPVLTDKPVVGVDLGVKALATVSDGTVFPNPKAFKCHLRKVKGLQRSIHRKVKGSSNRRKAVQKLARVHAKVANIRKDTLHKSTTTLAKTKSVVVLENLNVSGMLKNHTLAGSLADASFGEFRRMMEYKGKWYGCAVITTDSFYPSSKICSQCGHIKTELSLSQRVYVCEVCGFIHDRDLNAALNLASVAVSSTETLNACGGERFMALGQVLPSEAGTERQLGLS